MLNLWPTRVQLKDLGTTESLNCNHQGRQQPWEFRRCALSCNLPHVIKIWELIFPLDNAESHPNYQVNLGWTICERRAVKSSWWGLCIIYLGNIYVMTVSTWLYKKVRFLSLFAVSWWISYDRHHILFSYLFNSKTAFSLFYLWGEVSWVGRRFAFNYLSPNSVFVCLFTSTDRECLKGRVYICLVFIR